MSRKQPDLDLEPIFDKLFAAANASHDKDAIVKFLKAIKVQLELSSRSKPYKPAKSFTLKDAVDCFTLKYGSEYPDSLRFLWNIETLPGVKEMQPSAYLCSVFPGLVEIYDRSSGAACRVPVNVIIIHCLAEVKGMGSNPTMDEVPPIFSTIPEPWANVKAFCDISFAHSIDDTRAPDSQGVVVGGRVDHAVGIVLRRSMSKPYRRFHSLLLFVGAKVKDNLGSAFGQLVTYMASLRESRINRGKTDSSGYGVATDGLKYIFVTITNEGVLLFSKQFDVMSGDLPLVLGCLRYILEMAIAMSSNTSPKSGGLQNEVDDDADEGFYPDGSPYTEVDGDDDEDSDED